MTLSSERAAPVLPEWSFGDRLRKIRRDVADMGQKEFAQLLQVGPQAYAHWETGKVTPRNMVVIAQRVELATGVPAAWVLGVADFQPPGGAVTRSHTER